MRKIKTTTKPATSTKPAATTAKPAAVLPKLSAKAKSTAAIVAPVTATQQVVANRSNVVTPQPSTPIARVAASVTGAKPAATATSKPAAATATAKPAPASKLERFTFNDQRFLETARYPTGSFSDLDSNYLGYFASFAKSIKSGIINVAAIDNHDVANNVRAPGADGGGKLNNRARLHRLVGSGHCAYTDAAGHPVNGITSVYFTLTDKAKTLAVVTKATARTY